MYYQEKVINGTLCCKQSLNGKWVELSKEKLTERLMVIQSLYEDDEIKEEKIESDYIEDQINKANKIGIPHMELADTLNNVEFK